LFNQIPTKKEKVKLIIWGGFVAQEGTSSLSDSFSS
jgi:hypothetical protein